MFVVIANAAVTCILSSVDDRYQARVIWLVPLLAGIFVLEWLDHDGRLVAVGRRIRDLRGFDMIQEQPASP